MKKSEDCPPGKIRNPKTGRCVKIDGAIGRSLLSQSPKSQVSKVSEKSAPSSGMYLPVDVLEQIIDKTDAKTAVQFHGVSKGTKEYVNTKVDTTRLASAYTTSMVSKLIEAVVQLPTRAVRNRKKQIKWYRDSSADWKVTLSGSYEGLDIELEIVKNKTNFNVSISGSCADHIEVDFKEKMDFTPAMYLGGRTIAKFYSKDAHTSVDDVLNYLSEMAAKRINMVIKKRQLSFDHAGQLLARLGKNFTKCMIIIRSNMSTAKIPVEIFETMGAHTTIYYRDENDELQKWEWWPTYRMPTPLLPTAPKSPARKKAVEKSSPIATRLRPRK
jgi:hypothetical protein